MNDSAASSRLPLLVAAGALGLAVLGGGLWWSQRAPEPPQRTVVPSGEAAGAGPSASAAQAQREAPAQAASVEKLEVSEAPASDGGKLFELGWGNGHGQLGRGTSEFGRPSGPNAFVTGEDGSTWILDQFNNRMVRVGPDGKVLETRALKVQGAADLAIDKKGNMAVMDRSKDSRVDLYDKAGRQVASLPLPPDDPELGPMGRVFISGDKVYGQRGGDGGPTYWLGGIDGSQPPEGQDEINGQPSRDGTFLVSGGVADHDSGKVWVTGSSPTTMEAQWSRAFALDVEVEHTLLLDTDNQGVIYFVVKGLFGEDEAKAMVLCLDGKQRGAPIKMFMLAYSQNPLDTFRSFEVQPSGGLLAADEGEGGVGYRLYQCR